MENNPKKSKAFIITFILILLLLLVGYYLFSNRAKIFDTKGVTSLSKIFSPLLGNSTNKGLTAVNEVGVETGTKINTGITGVVITDNLGNRIVQAEAGENLKKGDVLYVSGFNANKDPIVMKAIANDKNKSLVFGVAGEDMNKGKMGKVIIEGILSGVPTNRNEGTLWASNNRLYLSDKVYGGMTKNAPISPSFIVPIGSVLKIDPIDGSIRIGVLDSTNLKSLNSDLINNSSSDIRTFWNSIFGNGTSASNNNGFTLKPITLPGGNDTNFPSVIVTAIPSSIKSGETSSINWTATNKAIKCDAGAGNGTNTTGTFITAKLTSSKSYTVVCTDANGSKGSGTVTVFINNLGENNIPTVSVTSKDSLIKPGTTSIISWTSTKAVSCDAGAGNGTGTKGSFTTPILTESKVYTITCTGADGSTGSNMAYVTISDANGNAECSDKKDNNGNKLIDAADPNCHTDGNAKNIKSYISSYFSESFPITGEGHDYPIVEVTATSPVLKGESSIVTWKSTNATVCDAGAGNGTGTEGSFTTEKLIAGKSFTVVCTGKNGSMFGTVFVGVTENLDNSPVVTVTATPPLIKSGETSSVSWISKNTTVCDSGKGNSTKVVGSFETEKLTESKSYTIKCTGTKGSSASDVVVNVNPDDVNITTPDIVTTDPIKTVEPPSMCLVIEQNPLTFTDEEKIKLATLLRKFYLISSTLKTSDDITAIYNEIDQQKNFISQIEQLTSQCYEEATDSVMTANGWVRHGNPWYTKQYCGTFPYTNEDTGYTKYSQLEGGTTPAGYKVISGYYYGTTSTGEDCSQYNNFAGYGKSNQINNNIACYLGHYLGHKGVEANNCGYPGDSILINNDDLPARQPDQKLLENGCKWKDGVILDNTERLLNIW